VPSQQVADALVEIAKQPEEMLSILVEMASVAIESARMVVGDEWRSVMVTALHGIVLFADGGERSNVPL